LRIFFHISIAVKATSALVKGLPSCQVTPWRSVTVSRVLSVFQRHSVASSGVRSAVSLRSPC
jgi:hypothetical protein